MLSPAAPLFREVELLLSEDPTTTKARKINLYHATLAGVASGNHAFGRLTRYLSISGPSLGPIVNSLIDAELLDRLTDPIRGNRPVYHPADPMLRFHYAVLRPNHARLARHGADVQSLWRALQPTFHSRVVGPCFEQMVRSWVIHHADPSTIGGEPSHVGPSVVDLDGDQLELDVVVAADDADTPAQRTVTAIGEAKSGEVVDVEHLTRLEAARTALGDRASGARLLLVGGDFSSDVVEHARRRSDVELVDLERLYHGD